jgi:exodeoxyribonuclease III
VCHMAQVQPPRPPPGQKLRRCVHNSLPAMPKSYPLSHIRVLSWNVNGIRAACNKGLRAWLEKERPDILCLQEIRANVDQISGDLRSPPGYHAYWNPSARRGYSGTAILSRRRPNKVSYGIGLPEFDTEGRVLIANYGDFSLVNAYYPNGNASRDRLRYKLRFCRALLAHIRGLRRTGETVLLCGDFNIAHTEYDLAKPQQNTGRSGFLPRERAQMDTLVADGLVDTLRHFSPAPTRHYTWRSAVSGPTNGWRFDYLFASAEVLERVTEAFVMSDVRLSDHSPIGIVLSDHRSGSVPPRTVPIVRDPRPAAMAS